LRARATDQFLDIHQADIHRKPIDVVRRIYDYFGLQLSDSVEQAMLERINRDPEGSHGEHRYALEDFGLTEDMIRERFSNYILQHLS
jgi:hypothetical protein